MSKFEALSFENIRTLSVENRHNLVRIDTMKHPDTTPVEPYGDEAFDTLCRKIAEARKNGRPVIWSQGAHVIKNNLSLYIIELMKAGIITHVAGNGACSIHDFELAYLGGTSEDVPTAIEDGSFGMWEETGSMMNEAIQKGVKVGLGYGESIGVYMQENAEKFPNKESSISYMAYILGIPCTYHVAIGTDIIHQHPSVDFAAIGAASGRDFQIMCKSICDLEDGVYLNFGSGVIGPEVFLKGLSISRNLGYQTFHITTANFDLKDLGDFRCKIGYSDPNYYYRPRKNIVNRPTSVGGWGWHFVGDHQVTIPNLYKKVKEYYENRNF